MTNKRIVLTTAGSEDEARKIAHSLVKSRLAACVNVVPRIQSIYRWHDKVESEQEWLLLIKTTADNFAAVRDHIRALHSYEVPECISLSIEEGSAEYLSWFDDAISEEEA